MSGHISKTCIRLLTAVLLLTPLGACAIGNRYEYAGVIADVRNSGNYPVGVATLDQRGYVMSMAKNPNFVGLQRAGFGNPFDVITENGRPLSDNVTEALVNSLKAKGFAAIPVATVVRDTSEQTVNKLMATNAPRSILVLLKEWKTDTYANVALYYSVEIQVRAAAGAVLATAQIEGNDNLGGSLWNPLAAAREGAPRAFKEKLEQLINDPPVVKALQGP